MDQVSINSLYAKYPQLEDIAHRLDQSFKQTEAINNSRKDYKKASSNQTEMAIEDLQKRQPRHHSKTPDHAMISKIAINGQWDATMHAMASGKQNFENALMRIMRRNPDAIEVVIAPTSKITSVTKPEIIIIKLKDVEITTPTTINEINSETSQKIAEQLAGLKNEIAKRPEVNLNNFDSKISELNFAQQLSEIKHSHEIETLKRDHQRTIDLIEREYQKQIEDLKEEIEDLEYEIEDLEAEAAETEDNLSGIEQKIKEAQHPQFIDILGKVGKSITENLIKDNTKGISKFLNINESELVQYFIDKEKAEDNEKPDNGNNSTFTESNPVIETFNNLPSGKKEVAEQIINLVDVLEIEDINAIALLLNKVINQDFTINKTTLQVLIKTADELNKQ